MPTSTRPAHMRCIEIREPGGPEKLVPTERPVPVPAAGEVLIAVHAAGVNRPDVIQRVGDYPSPPGASDLPRLEVAGKVVAVAEGVASPAVGANVCALVPGGGYAEYVTAPAVTCLPIPNGLTITEAAALPETFFTVWHNVFERGGLKTGESFLVHGGASGIGTTAIQLAKAFGAHIITTASSDEKCDACLKLGADVAINYKHHRLRKGNPHQVAWQRRRRDSRYGGGAVPRAEHLLLESRRPTREHRFFARIESRRGFHARDAETADLDRIDAAPAGHGVQGRHRVGA